MTRKRRVARTLTIPIFLAVVISIFTGVVQIIYTRYLLSSRVNVIKLVGGRIQTAGNVIASRLRRLQGVDASKYELLMSRFEQQPFRALYTVFGPSIGECVWCDFKLSSEIYVDEHTRYQLIQYIAPEVLWPYIVNAAVTLFSTSLWTKETRNLRTPAIICLALAAAYDLYGFATYSYTENSELTNPDWFYWRQFMYRGYILFAYNGVMALLYFLAGTGRLFDTEDPVDTKLIAARDLLNDAVHKSQVENALRSVVRESDYYRNKHNTYWKHNTELRSQFDDDVEVQEARDNGMERMNVGRRRSEYLALVNSYA
ncbi:hypothetical protein AWJ20_3010 [Sugiyamaella lignohabitans]|uniref:Uncharacterized protein n=1 Tax=Sugiyamaella lignohabitans TaxID=796027 RepID=A0A167FJK0_9ASCO|nr:uncharacterized protein AWJ20_3010 [Sugiyamaella lignohabitans]ANB15383.1 hypothetical protein AWJ20_3010 [Sugiyamaella lignohabitans]